MKIYTLTEGDMTHLVIEQIVKDVMQVHHQPPCAKVTDAVRRGMPKVLFAISELLQAGKAIIVAECNDDEPSFHGNTV